MWRRSVVGVFLQQTDEVFSTTISRRVSNKQWMCLQQIADVLASSRCVFNKQQKYQQQTEGVSTTNRGCFNNRGSVYNQQRMFQQQTEGVSTNRGCFNNKQRKNLQQTTEQNDGTVRRQSWACSEQLPAWRGPSRRSSAHPSARPWVVSSHASFSPPASSSRSR